jgi:hypothetical protein
MDIPDGLNVNLATGSMSAPKGQPIWVANMGPTWTAQMGSMSIWPWAPCQPQVGSPYGLLIWAPHGQPRWAQCQFGHGLHVSPKWADLELAYIIVGPNWADHMGCQYVLHIGPMVAAHWLDYTVYTLTIRTPLGF